MSEPMDPAMYRKLKPNPPIPGHELLYEGGTQPIWGDAKSPWGSVQGHKGGCACGAQPPGFPNVSNNKMKQWHREHKAQIRREMSGEKLSPERAIRLLRAKAGELEHKVLLATELQEEQRGVGLDQAYIAATEFKYLVADIALVATLLADHMERSPGPWGPEDEDWGIDDANVRDMRDER